MDHWIHCCLEVKSYCQNCNRQISHFTKQVPASSRQFEPREMKRAFDGDYYSKSDLYSNALPALRINGNYFLVSILSDSQG